jgi:hypothetical protein
MMHASNFRPLALGALAVLPLLLLAFSACVSKPASPQAPRSASKTEKPADAGPSSATAPVPAALDPGEETGSCAAPDGPIGTSLYRPERAPSAAVLVDVGAQSWNRYGDLPQGKAWSHYRAFAQALRTAGVATMLFDKRGTGLTGGRAADVDGRIRDSRAAEKCLRAALPRVPLVRLGHSAGSMIACRAAAAGERLVLLSPVVSVDEMPDLPTLLVRGGNDGGASADAARLAAHPKARQVVAPGADHLLMITEDGRSVVSPVALAAVVDFVTGG